jgi:hypothetical protein
MTKTVKKSSNISGTDYWIRLLIHGLMVSAFKKNGEKYELEIGVLNRLISDHRLQLIVHERNEDNNPLVHRFNLTENSKIQFEGFSRSGIEKCVDPNNEIFNPKKSSREDYRWILDFDKEYFEGNIARKLTKISYRLGTSFCLSYGKLYTMIRSAELYKKNNAAFQKIAQVMAIDMKPEPLRPRVSLNVYENGKEVDSYTFSYEKIYHVAFRYDCGNHCVRDYEANDSQITNYPSDLNHLNSTFELPRSTAGNIIYYSNNVPPDLGDYETVTAPSGGDKYALLGLDDVFQSAQPYSRRDPCGMALFGNSDGLDDNS